MVKNKHWKKRKPKWVTKEIHSRYPTETLMEWIQVTLPFKVWPPKEQK